MSQGPKRNQLSNSGEIWREFIAVEQKSNSKLGKVFAAATYGGYENRTLTLYFADDTARKAAQGQIDPLKNKLKSRLICDRVDCCTGKGTPPPPPSTSKQLITAQLSVKNTPNPLQTLNLTSFGQDRQGKELTLPILQAAVKAEKGCAEIYTKLKQRTLNLAGGENNTIKVSFDWRIRVGGTRGFCELLLPVLHPVFGIPYIPASSLKGAAKAWADAHHPDKREIQELLGMLEQRNAKAAKVEFLDAFPTEPCLSADVATPQWHWRNQNQQVVYNPEPHPLLSLEQPQLLIGLCPTARGDCDDIKVVKVWLQNALKTGGIGSRISSGYGRTITQEAHLPHSQSFNFELWTQGMYGSNPPSRENNYQGSPEFRPTAVRGILRYWFRAVALGLYDPATCLSLEERLFGKLGQQGTISISVRTNPLERQKPLYYTGRIILEAKEKQDLKLVERSLILASHLGGVGRGSRRPLHLLNSNLRGCHWVVKGDNLPLAYDEQQWKSFFDSINTAFKAVQASIKAYTSSPGEPRQGHRQQDVLDKNAQVWLLKTIDLVNPEDVKDWQTEGDRSNVRGSALNLLYSSTKFKGGNPGQGNAYVGGNLGTPSFVWIKSLFPAVGSLYQVVTIFGADNSQRLDFAKELKNQGAILVRGQMSSGNTSHPLSKPRKI